MQRQYTATMGGQQFFLRHGGQMEPSVVFQLINADFFLKKKLPDVNFRYI